MNECPSLSACPFYNDKMQSKPGIANMYKKRYCQTNNSTCARWMIASKLGKDAVPTDLYPNQKERAEAILA